MKTDQLQVVLRPRSAFESLDLGFAAAARYFLTLWALWLAAAIPSIVISHALLLKSWMFALLFLWWAKPFFETPLLYWLSRKIFNEGPGLGSTIRTLPAITLARVLPRLAWRRFSPNRSFYTPVMLLEGMRGRAYAERAALLGSNQTAGLSLTFICILFELVLFISMLILVDLMIPDVLVETGFAEWLFQAEGFSGLLCLWLAILAISIVAPFYVAAGFLLYLNRRTILEAWDIELKFKRLMQKRSRSTRIAVLSLALVAAIAAAGVSSAAAPASQIDKQAAKQRIEEVLSSEDFGRHKTVSRWRLKQFEAEFGEDRDLPFQGALRFLARSLELVIKLALWIAGGALLALFLYFLAKNFGLARTRREKALRAPRKLFGLPLTPESLPGDIAAEASKLFMAGRMRAALSLLYRGALFHLVDKSLLEIPESATEGECMAIVRKHRPPKEARYFRTLTNTWRRMAYGHIRPRRRTVAALLAGWGEFYAIK